MGFLSRGIGDKKGWHQRIRKKFNEKLVISKEKKIRVHDILENIVFVGLIQRLASKYLISDLSGFEQWIYRNIQSKIWNEDKAKLPSKVPFIRPEDVETYEKIRVALESDITIPKRAAYGKYDKEEHERLHKSFLYELQGLGQELSIRDQYGNERRLNFLDEK